MVTLSCPIESYRGKVPNYYYDIGHSRSQGGSWGARDFLQALENYSCYFGRNVNQMNSKLYKKIWDQHR